MKMAYSILVRKILLRNERYLSKEELTEISSKLKLSYTKATNYLLTNKYLYTIFRGFFFVPSVEERKLSSKTPDILEAISKAMEYKGIKNWYFGLETAIKHAGITHESFSIDYVISDKIFRPKPIEILGRKIKFIKLKKELCDFGVTKDKYLYSDLEKTILDIVYLKRYSGEEDSAIKSYLVEWAEKSNKKKLVLYSKKYPDAVTRLAEEFK
ncbi:MAG: hypothetical protein WCI04_02160 [archaeon]